MVKLFTRDKSKSQKQMLDTAEAFNLWDLLAAKYRIVDRVNIWKNLVHDRDLLLIFDLFIETMNGSIKFLEEKAKLYNIRTPDRPRKSVKTSANHEIITDEWVAEEYFIWLQENIEMLLKNIRTSTTNDELRALYVESIKDSISFIDKVIKYLKLKGWIATPPMYPNIPSTTVERIDAGEAYHLWDHLTYRYDNYEQTTIWLKFVRDPDLKRILENGLSLLEKQISGLEKELDRFGIPLPVRPPAAVKSPLDSDLLEDDCIFRELLMGIQGATSLHAQGFKRCTTNDRVRGIFNDLLLREIEMIDDLIKFGKMKGWLHPVPNFYLE